MKMSTLKLKTLAACTVAVFLLSGYSIASELMFRDTFFTTDGMYVNDEIDTEGRQSGTVAPLDYTGDEESLLNAIIGDADIPNWLILENNSFISPNHNFTDVGTNYNVEFDLKLNRIAGTSWAGFIFQMGAESQDEGENGTGTGFYWWLQRGQGGQRLITAGKDAALGIRSRWRNSELYKLEEEPVHINCIVSTKSFGGSDKVTTALFVNGEPITARQRNGTIGYGTVFELNQSLTNNFTVLGSDNEPSVECNFQVDNYTIRKTEPHITVHDWTNDASSLITSSKIYTHAVNCNGEDVVINGVKFAGATDGANTYDAGTNWVGMDYNNDWAMGTGNDSTTTIAGSGAVLATSFFYSRISSTLKLYNLVPGLEYTLTLYNNSSTASLHTRLVPSDSEAALSILDQNRGIKGNVFRYTYKASSNGVFSITFDNSPVDSADAAQNWRLYAFSNEIAIGGDKPILSITPTNINFNTIIDDSTNVEILVKNIGGGTVSGTVTDIIVPFSISTNWYSAASNASCTLTVAFNPTEEGNFTNVIHFSGTGGSQDVTLIGEAIPECSLLISGLMLVVMVVRRIL